MINFSIALFALAAILGLVILIKWLNKKNAPRGVVYSHGAVAAGALALLAYYAYEHPNQFPVASLVLFVVAAIAGFYMFAMDMKKKIVPLGIAFTHAIVAVIAFVALLIFAFS